MLLINGGSYINVLFWSSPPRSLSFHYFMALTVLSIWDTGYIILHIISRKFLWFQSGSILCLLCSVCQRIIDPWPSSKKSKKNPASNDKMQALNQLVVQLLNQFNSLGTFLRECQESIKLDDSNVTAAMDALKLNDKRSSRKSEELLSQGILESYHQTFDNLAQMIKSKTKFLKTLNS